MALERKCKCCKEMKTTDDFYITGKSKKTGGDTYRRECKECMKLRVKKWKQDNPDLQNEYCNTWIANNRERWNEYSNLYRRENYDPVKKREANMRYRYGNSYGNNNLVLPV